MERETSLLWKFTDFFLQLCWQMVHKMYQKFASFAALLRINKEKKKNSNNSTCIMTMNPILMLQQTPIFHQMRDRSRVYILIPQSGHLVSFFSQKMIAESRDEKLQNYFRLSRLSSPTHLSESELHLDNVCGQWIALDIQGQIQKFMLISFSFSVRLISISNETWKVFGCFENVYVFSSDAVE